MGGAGPAGFSILYFWQVAGVGIHGEHWHRVFSAVSELAVGFDYAVDYFGVNYLVFKTILPQ